MNLKNVIQCMVASGILFSSMAHSIISVTFIEPDATVGSSDEIPVWVRMTTDTGFNFDGSDPDGDGTYGDLDPGDIPVGGFNHSSGQNLDFAQITGANTSVSFTCSGSFTSSSSSPCSPGDEYKFSFNSSFNSSDPAFNTHDVFTLDAGESQDFLFGKFIPVDGSAALGTYNFYSANFTIRFFGFGFDDSGNQVDLDGSFDLASTCTTGDDSCDFSRTVVPLPTTVWLFSSALLGLVGAAVRRGS